ncbi:hypothetical protein FRC09_010205, partial [Ceratobasidium sp. 395]
LASSAAHEVDFLGPRSTRYHQILKASPEKLLTSFDEVAMSVKEAYEATEGNARVMSVPTNQNRHGGSPHPPKATAAV